MMKVERIESPQTLKENYKAWGKTYRQYLENNPTSQYFYWHNSYQEIEDALFIMTNNHCSFCDIRPLRAAGATVEHFRPKKKFPLLAYAWANLFYCCANCQKKGSKFDLNCRPLKPDKLSYFFDYYFILIETAEEIFIRPNPIRLIKDQEMAEMTINCYGLNKYGRPEARKAESEDYKLDIEHRKIKELKNYSFRFLFL